jgi:hypothetical protein
MASKPPKDSASKKSPVPQPTSTPSVNSPTSYSSVPHILQRFQSKGMTRLSPTDVRTLQQTAGNRAIQRMMATPVIQRVLTPEEAEEKKTILAEMDRINKLLPGAKFREEKKPGFLRIKIRLAELNRKEGQPDPAEVERQRQEQAERDAAERERERVFQAEVKKVRVLTNKAIRAAQQILTPATAEMSNASGYEIPELATVNEQIQRVSTKVTEAQAEIANPATLDAANAAKAKAEAAANEAPSLTPLVQGISDKVKVFAAEIALVHTEMKPLYTEVSDASMVALQRLTPVTTHALVDKEALKEEIKTIKEGALKALTTAKNATTLAKANKAKEDIIQAIVAMEAAKAKATTVGQKEIAMASDDAYGGHVVSRHGPEIDSQKILDRLVTNIAPDGKYSPAGSLSSQFTSYSGLNSALTTVKPLILAAMKKSYQKVAPKIKLYQEAKAAYELAEKAVQEYVPAPVVATATATGGTPPPPAEDPLAKLEKTRDTKSNEMGVALANVQAEVNLVRTTAGHCQLMFDSSTQDPNKLVTIYGEYQIVHDHGGVIGKGYRRGATDVDADAVDLQRTRTKFAFDSNNTVQFLIGGDLNVAGWIVVQHFPTDEAVGIL